MQYVYNCIMHSAHAQCALHSLHILHSVLLTLSVYFSQLEHWCTLYIYYTCYILILAYIIIYRGTCDWPLVEWYSSVLTLTTRSVKSLGEISPPKALCVIVRTTDISWKKCSRISAACAWECWSYVICRLESSSSKNEDSDVNDLSGTSPCVKIS